MMLLAMLLLFASGDRAYQQGVEATTVEMRQNAFNEALQEYLLVPASPFGTGKLEYNIGNTFYQLGEYPWAILYYEKALKLRPRDENVKINLRKAEGKLGLTAEVKKSLFSPLFFFHHSLSLAEKLRLFFLFGILALITFRIKKIFPLFLLTSFLFLGSALYSHYIEPMKAVVVLSANLYKGAGKHYALVSGDPIPAGSRVKILDPIEKGEWVKIESEEGLLGYIPSESLRTINSSNK